MRSRLTASIGAFAIALMSVACAQTDAGITTAVKGKLAANDDVKAYQIDVDTRDKIVTLTGNVDTATAKTRAVELARGTDGVASVVDNITVKTMASQPPAMPDAAPAAFTDAAITTSIKTKFAADTTVSALRIDVDTANAMVTLTGDVRSKAEKDQAMKLARETDGVKDVVDKLTIKP